MKIIFKFLLLIVVISVAVSAVGFTGKELIAQKKDKEIETAVDRLLSEDYEFELTRFIAVEKGSEVPELINLEVELDKEFVSSRELKKDNSEKGKNIARLAKLKGEMMRLSKDSKYEYIQPSYIYHSDAWTTSGGKDTPNDFDLNPNALNGNHWYYERSNLRELWNKQDCANGGEGCGGSSEVVVAVIDTGLAYEDRTSAWVDSANTPFNFDPLPDMFSGGSINLWVNEAEIPGNNIDDDDNGFVDDVHGVNTANYIYCNINPCSSAQSRETVHPNDDGGHGTYVTGLIASLVDNGLGSVSPVHNVSIMPIKANFRKQPSFGTLELEAAINYAKNNGAHIINMSLAGSSADPRLEQAINDAYNSGVIIIASSGNSGGGVMYPAKYSNTVAVGAVNADGTRSSYSSYGSELDLVAYVGSGGGTGKGTAVYQSGYTCFFQSSSNNCYNSTNLSRYTQFSNGYAIGTSFAAPQVAAAAAIIKGNNLDISLTELKMALGISTNDLNIPGSDIQTGAGVIDFYKTGEYVMETLYKSFFAEYIVQGSTRNSWVITANPSEIENLYTVNRIGNMEFGPNSVPVGLRLSKSYLASLPQSNKGPLEVISNNPAFSSQVNKIGDSFYQIHGIDFDNLSNEYYFPEYIVNSSRSSWLIIGNPSEEDTINVSINIGGEVKGPYSISPSERISKKYTNLNPHNLGPVKVHSENLFYTSQVNSVNQTFNQIQGIKSSELTNEYYYPEYITNSFRSSWLIIGNPSEDENANVNITIGEESKGPYSIPPGERISKKYLDLDPDNKGPVKITSDKVIYTSQVGSINRDFYQMTGLIPSQLKDSFFYPEYIINPNRSSWIIIGNPSEDENANVSILIGNEVFGPYLIAPRNRISNKYNNLSINNRGPVKITADVEIYTIQMNKIVNSFYLVPGM